MTTLAIGEYFGCYEHDSWLGNRMKLDWRPENLGYGQVQCYDKCAKHDRIQLWEDTSGSVLWEGSAGTVRKGNLQFWKPVIKQYEREVQQILRIV